MIKLIIADDILNSDNWEEFDTENLIEFLMQKYDSFPEGGKLYHNTISMANEVTPLNEADIESLSNIKDGVIYLLILPGEPISIGVAILAIAATAAAAFLIKPKTPNAKRKNSSSPNNDIGERQNSARLNSRIPDIYGTVRSIPDLISIPYTIYDGNNPYEISLMCIGRGDYNILDIREGETSAYNILNKQLAIYGPNTSPNSGSPIVQIGDTIPYSMYAFNILRSINGQLLLAPDAVSRTYASSAFQTFKFGTGSSRSYIQANSGGVSPDFSGYLAVGDSVTITHDTNSALNGTFVVYSVSAYLLIFTTTDADYTQTSYSAQGFTIDKAAANSLVGPFDLTDTATDTVIANVVAPSGIYTVSTSTGAKTARDVDFTLNVWPTGMTKAAATTAGLLFGGNYTITGASANSLKRALTVKLAVTTGYVYQMDIARITNKYSTGQDDIIIEAFYYGKTITQANFGNVTIAHVISKQTDAASATERKFNCLVQRKLPQRVSGTTFTTTLYGTNSADEIISAICLDQYIGRRTVSEIDFDNLYTIVAAIKAYFGNSGVTACGEFNYTFDDNNISFEETIASICATIHSIAYRQGSVIKFKFEKENSISTLLFNHKNKIPNSEVRSFSFGVLNNYDGVSVNYIDPNTDVELVLQVPNTTGVNYKEVEFLGLRSKVQAYYLAWRQWNKLKYQNIAVEFTALPESDLVTLTDRILVSDNTRNDTVDGEILSQTILDLKLSIVHGAAINDVIYFQYYDGTVDSRTISAIPAADTVTINSAPTLPLSLDIDNYARTTFIIVKAGSLINYPFIVIEKTMADKFTRTLRAINYDANYYANDHVNPATI